MKNNLHTLLKLLSMGLVVVIPVSLTAQELPDGDPPPAPEDVPDDLPPPPPPPPEDPEEPELDEEGDGPPQEVVDFLNQLEALRNAFLGVVQAEYEATEDMTAGELRAQAIQGWLAENRPVIDDLEEAQEAANAAGEAVELPDDTLSGERPGPSQNRVDLEALLQEKLATVASENEALEEALETAELDRQEMLAELMAARDARLEEIKAARDAAKAQRDDARENSEGARRGDDDLPGGG